MKRAALPPPPVLARAHVPESVFLPLYMGQSGDLERTFYEYYGNEVDCSRYGAYGVFNSYGQAQPGTTPGCHQ